MQQAIGDWTERFDGTRQLPRDLRDRLLRLASLRRFKAGETVFAPGRVPNSLLLLLEGTIRVFQTSDSGREIVLYRVEAGQSCVLTTACILAEEAYSAEGVAETDVVAVALPRSAFDRLAADSEAFRQFVFAAYSRRLLDLLRVVDDVAFGKIDVRLAARLVALADAEGALNATHQQLATELGTAREVISRQLTEFQRRGWIEAARGRILLRDVPALKALARQK
ncbi:cAMP receptor protein [Pseudoruegeria aquimaris]|uniref:cAMP receptor protein n=1 Tax=Pseudoruegeria aquimaris TaxID=393663 RepID=A0A1Y5SKW8_9RHOB|nr:Crp/Fnr family transcriptional regulator [Pseudoruegeria aquimaris]SLN43019.1 cAMP receptor protein [Pseudoruegeria aquimaris]